MAEKEKRILITTRHKNEKLNMTFTDMYKEYTRQEAIERMAIAIKCVPKASGEAVHSTDYAKWAEAALDALLK